MRRYIKFYTDNYTKLKHLRKIVAYGHFLVLLLNQDFIYNAYDIYKVRRANSERNKLTKLQNKEITLAKMLMVVVVVFFVCNILALVVNILEVLSINIGKNYA